MHLIKERLDIDEFNEDKTYLNNRIKDIKNKI